MMSFKSLHAAALFAITLATSPIAWAHCDQTGLKNRLILELEPTNIVVREDLSYADIQKESKLPIPTGMPQDSFIGGFTRTQISSRVKIETQSVPKNGKVCVGATLHLFIAEPTATVFLPKDEPKNSCRYQITYRHEMQHVAIFQRGLRQVLMQEGAALRARVAETLPTLHADEATAKTYYETMAKALTVRIERALNKINDAQKSLDTPDNYRLESERVALCESRRMPKAESVSSIVDHLPQHPTDPRPLPDPILRGKRAEEYAREVERIRQERLRLTGNAP